MPFREFFKETKYTYRGSLIKAISNLPLTEYQLEQKTTLANAKWELGQRKALQEMYPSHSKLTSMHIFRTKVTQILSQSLISVIRCIKLDSIRLQQSCSKHTDKSSSIWTNCNESNNEKNNNIKFSVSLVPRNCLWKV